MSCKEMVNKAKSFWVEIKDCKKQLTSQTSQQVSNETEKNKYNELASKWFSDFSKPLLRYGLLEDVVSKYDEEFKAILRLSSSQSRRKTYQKHMDTIAVSFNDDIVIFLQTEAEAPEDVLHGDFEKAVQELLGKVKDKDVNIYLQEAMGCWQSNYLRGATVLLWCSAIDRIHRVIEKNGFEAFNKTCAFMKSQTTGRYKKFNKDYNVQSLSELRMVFDSDVLSILEGMQLIDANEKARLLSCFDMRNHSGHPGEAPITKYNVLSCFSDIVEIVLSNPKFEINSVVINKN